MAPVADTGAAHGRVLSVRQSLNAMAGLCLVVMLVAIDQTVVGTALPTIVAELNGFELYAWVATAYLLTSVITIPIFGRLGDYYGRRIFVIASIIVFTIASILSGLANSMLQLVMARGLQGVGGGMLVGTAFACIPDLFPDSHVRLRWQVLISAAFGIANAIGPSLGGLLTYHLGWRSIFFINLPIGLLGLFYVWRYLPQIRHVPSGAIRLDWQGALLLALGLGSLQLFVEFLPDSGLSLFIIALGLFSAGCFVVLVRWEKRCPEPLLPMDMLRKPALATLFSLSLLTGITMFTLLFYVPLLLQGGFGMTAQGAGLLITPLVVSITLGSILNGRLITRLPNPNAMLYCGFLFLACCCLGVIFMGADTALALKIVILVMGGMGMGFIMPNLTVYAQEIAGRSLLGITTAMLQSMRMIGGMVGMTVVGTIVGHFYAVRVRSGLAADQAGEDWAARLQDPQVLVNEAVQQDLLERLHSLGLHGAAYIGSARDALVSSVHLGLLVSMAVALLAVLGVRRVPPIQFTRVRQAPADTPEPAEE